MEDTISSLSEKSISTFEKDQLDKDPEKMKDIYTKENPHPTGAYWDKELQKWQGYKAIKGMSPPWLPFSRRRVKTEPNIRERKFMWILGKTGSITEAYRATYRVKANQDKRVESARARAMGEQVLRRIKVNFPEWVKSFTFSDITPDFIRNEYMGLYNSEHATIAEKKSILDSMSKLEKLFNPEVGVDVKIREVVNPLYKESDDDFPRYRDDRIVLRGQEGILKEETPGTA